MITITITGTKQEVDDAVYAIVYAIKCSNVCTQFNCNIECDCDTCIEKRIRRIYVNDNNNRNEKRS